MQQADTSIELTDADCIRLYHTRPLSISVDGQKSSAAASVLLEHTYVLAAVTNLWRSYTSLRVTQSYIPTWAAAAELYHRQINVVIWEVARAEPGRNLC